MIMKRYIYIAAIIISCLCSCERDDGLLITSFGDISVEAMCTTADITIQMEYTSGYASNNDCPTIEQYGVYYSTTQTEPTGRDGSCIVEWEYGVRPNYMVLTLTDLQPNTTYYYRVFVRNSSGSLYSETKRFTTKESDGRGYVIEDFIGTYNLNAWNVNTQRYETWGNIKIYTWTNSQTNSEWVAVSGLNGGYDFEVALGEYDATYKAIRLYSDYGFTSNTYKFEGNDTSFISFFFPIYVMRDGSGGEIISKGKGYQNKGEAWLTFNSQGQLILRGSEFPDSNGYVANGYVFGCYYAETYQFYGWWDVFMEVVLTKISSSVEAPAKQNSKKVNVHRQSKLIKTCDL
jgi:hypothetical protein